MVVILSIQNIDSQGGALSPPKNHSDISYLKQKTTMIRVFAKLRNMNQKSQNFLRYMQYAIGKILLINIGTGHLGRMNPSPTGASQMSFSLTKKVFNITCIKNKIGQYETL